MSEIFDADFIKLAKGTLSASEKTKMSVTLFLERYNLLILCHQRKLRVDLVSSHQVSHQVRDGKYESLVEEVDFSENMFHFRLECIDKPTSQQVRAALASALEVEGTEYRNEGANEKGHYVVGVRIQRWSKFEYRNFLRKYCPEIRSKKAAEEIMDQERGLIWPQYYNIPLQREQPPGLKLGRQTRCLKVHWDKIFSLVFLPLPEKPSSRTEKEIIERVLKQAHEAESELKKVLKGLYKNRKYWRKDERRRKGYYQEDCKDRIEWVIHHLSEILLYYKLQIFKYEEIEALSKP